MTKTIALLGATGSIGRQTLEVAGELGLRVAALTANTQVDLLEQQARQYMPRLAVLYDENAALALKKRLRGTGIEVMAGEEGLLAAAAMTEADTVVTAVMGSVGLRPTLAAIQKGKRIALANKETLVCAGELVMDAAEKYGAEIVPVDSEHSAVFQCLQGCRDRGEVRRILLTCSGGPFYGKTFDELEVYRAEFRPMKATLSGRQEKTIMKLVVNAADRRVVGAHILGHEAGEMAQLLGISLKAGVTKDDFDRTMAVHPTASEELVTMYQPSYRVRNGRRV